MEKLSAIHDAFGNSISQWAQSLAITIAVYIAFRLIFNFLVKSKLNDTLADALKNSKFWFFAALALFIGTKNLNFGEFHFIPLKVLILTTFVQIGIWLSVVLKDVLINWSKKNNPNADKNAGFTIISGIGHFLIWSAILLLILDNFGVKVVSLMAGLGVGGIALALAVQKILGDLFASISIMIDKPFEAGDFIAIGELRGTVESTGIKTTRLRSLTGEQIVIANSDILDSRVNNFKRMEERRIVFTFGVSYKTPREHLETITELTKNIITSQSDARFERGHIKSFDASSIDYEFVYWVTKPDFPTYMEVQQKINLALMDAFAEKNIEMARPTQMVFIHGSDR
ncbi:MAG: mechanosensitive ion channel family protein [Fibromonadales bacterium]|nr:mechanosensitive ion channel family protein [Fibromonadales bacterium]